MTELEKILKKIETKIILGLPLTEKENAMWTLYGDKK